MIKIDTLDRNRPIFNPNINSDPGYGILDFTKSNMKTRGNIVLKEIYLANSEDVMRCDLIANKKYGNSGRMGSLLKFNGFSNPFSLDEGDLIYVPTDDSIEKSFSAKKESLKNVGTEDSNSAFRKSQESKKFITSPSRKEYLNNLKNKTAQELPPNVLQTGERPIVTKSGLIFFGPDATNQNG